MGLRTHSIQMSNFLQCTASIFLAPNLEMKTFYKVFRPNLFTRCRWDCCRYLLNTNNTDTFWLPNSEGTNAFEHFKIPAQEKVNSIKSSTCAFKSLLLKHNVIEIGEDIAKNKTLILNALTTCFPPKSELEY